MGYEVDFLPVGEKKCGDAIALRYGNLYGARSEQFVAVVDGGFKEAGESLVSHVKSYYNTDIVDLMVSTHPDSDHANGLEVVIDELEVRRLWMHRPWNHTDDIATMFRDGRVTDNSVREALRASLDTARSLERIAATKGIPIEEPFTGMKDDHGGLVVVGPTQQYYESLLPGFRTTPEPAKSVPESLVRAAGGLVAKVAERWGLETLDDDGETTAENNSSVILILTVGEWRVLLTADAGIPALTRAADALDAANFDYGTLQLLQVPHHGSRRNVGPTIMDRLLGPKLGDQTKLRSAFASVGTDSEPKHPAKKVTNAFLRRGAPVCVTKGETIRHSREAPDRAGWGPITPLPLYEEVED